MWRYWKHRSFSTFQHNCFRFSYIFFFLISMYRCFSGSRLFPTLSSTKRQNFALITQTGENSKHRKCCLTREMVCMCTFRTDYFKRIGGSTYLRRKSLALTLTVVPTIPFQIFLLLALRMALPDVFIT